MVKTYNEIEFYESAEALSTLCPPFIPGLQLNIAGCRYAFVKTCCAVFGFSLACRYFRNNWMSRKEHWACHITQKCFTGGLIASSFAESSGSAQGRWFQQHELLASVLMASTHGVPSDPPLVAECRAKYSHYVTELVLIEAIESKNYTAFIALVSLQTAGTIFNGDMSAEVVMNIKVKRNICTEKDRTVATYAGMSFLHVCCFAHSFHRG
jgi:hypothetical protein